MDREKAATIQEQQAIVADHLREHLKGIIGLPISETDLQKVEETLQQAIEDLKAKQLLPGITGIKVERVSNNEIRLGCVLHGDCRDRFLESYLRQEESGSDSSKGSGNNSSGL